MRVRLLSNPRSGRGSAAVIASSLQVALRDAGHEVATSTVGDPPAVGDTAPPPDVVVVIGGDGTLHRALPELARPTDPGSPAPGAVYHVPTGTENLFARQFGMTADPARLLAALDRGRIETVDLGECNGVLFALMVSTGPDAGVVHRLAAVRGGAIGRWHYARPLIAEALRPRLGPVRVVVDGREIAAGRGTAVVANSRQYGMRLDPARGAVMNDALLDAVFVPCGSGAAMAVRMVALRMGRLEGLVTARGSQIQVEDLNTGTSAPVQMDGEASGTRLPLECRVVPAGLRILVP